MSWLQFLASVIGSIAWPATVIVVVIILRDQLRRVILTLTRLKYGNLEIEFGRELKELEKKAKALDVVRPVLPRPTPPTPRNAVQLLADAETLAEDFPGPAVVLAWSAVEAEILSAETRLGLARGISLRQRPGLRIAQLLLDQGLIDSDTYDVLRRLRDLRNLAAHGPQTETISTGQAREFIAFAQGVVEKLQKLGQG